MNKTVVYTDGACSGNPGPGGWAWAIDGGRSDSGSDLDTTNQRMELTAVLEALKANTGAVEIVSDSTYVVNCFNDRWYEGWLKRNWRNSNRKPVANRDLWEPVVEQFQRRRDELVFTWVKGHSGDRMNDVVDAMAVAEVDRIRPTVAPKSTDGGVSAASVVHADAPWPVERAVVVLGPRRLSGDQEQWLERAIGGLDPAGDVVVSGLRRGVELRAAELALAHKITLGAVLPFAEPAQGWPANERQRFDAAMRLAQWTVDLELKKSDVAGALKARDGFLANSVSGAIIIDNDALANELDANGLAVVTAPIFD